MAAKNLVIVESPSKAKTIEKFLGSRYKVVATVGHLRDLPKSRLGVDIENDFAPEYINVRGKAETINEIKTAAKAAQNVYLATDPDREGEAISWHVCTLLGDDPANVQRIEFNEITKSAITEAVKHPRPIDMDLVNAQQGRRVLDRVVGFKISPLLWNKVGRGLSAGRVQSAALKIIVDREREIKAFVPQEFWIVSAKLMQQEAKAKDAFTARLETAGGKKLSIPDEDTCRDIRSAIEGGRFIVSEVRQKQETRRPYAPFTTSTLMQDASSKLGFTTDKTRRTAQQLYEGVNVKGHGNTGLVTYIRTDSVRISEEADAACKAYIEAKYSKAYLGNNVYTNKDKSAQDAHEAIRPSHMDIEPESVRDSLSPDQYRLYKLIWDRFVASRMKPALYDSVSADIICGSYGFKATGRHMIFDGFLKVYGQSAEDKDKPLPALVKGEELKLLSLDGEQKFTEGPSRFTEASLIKELEDNGIGRPSTYAAIVSTLEDRRYVKKDKKSLVPSELGFKVTEIMEQYFRELVDTAFTAEMEGELDVVAEGNALWNRVVADYYNSYIKDQLTKAAEELEKTKIAPEETGEMCPECGRPLVKRQSRYGSFVGCSAYPACRYIKPNIVKLEDVKCPKCGKDILKKKSRKGKIFYGCSGYPDCDMVFWYRPVNKVCPQCGQLLTEHGKKLVCSNQECNYSEVADKTSEE